MRDKRSVAVVMGSFGEEHEASVAAGFEMVRQIQEGGKFNTVAVVVSEEGDWKVHLEDKVVDLDMETFTACDSDGAEVKFDVVFLATRGSPGVDGSFQTKLDELGIPYTNSGADAAKLTYNKFECSNILRQSGVPVPHSILITENPPSSEAIEKLDKSFGYPCFVKPNKAMGSIGINKVDNREDLLAAISEAFTYDNEVVLEMSVENGQEVTCTVHDLTFDDLVGSLPVSDITPPKGEFYRSNSISVEGLGLNTEIVTPSKTLNTEMVNEVSKVAKACYKALDMEGLAAVDLLVQDDMPVVVDVNSVPRLGEDSVVTKQITSGLSILWQRNITRFYNLILERCIEHQGKHASKTSQANSGQVQRGTN